MSRRTHVTIPVDVFEVMLETLETTTAGLKHARKFMRRARLLLAAEMYLAEQKRGTDLGELWMDLEGIDVNAAD